MVKSMRILLIAVFLLISGTGLFAGNDQKEGAAEQQFDALGMIMHHISDSHYWHVISFEKKDGSLFEISLPLPVILIYDGSVHFFLSSAFHHGESIVNEGRHYFKLHHDKIYVTDASGELTLNDDGVPTNIKPLDFSITRNVASMWITVLVLFALFITAANKYKGKPKMPRGVQSFLEPLILFVRNEIVIEQIGEKKADRFMPFLLTVFFFIWINNIIGLVPFFPGGSNVSGNIAFTLILALATFILINVNGTKTYWKHIFATPGVPAPVRIILIPVEIVSMFTKPFALMIRLFANITAGHIIILSITSLIFVLKTVYVAPVSISLTLFMFMLELLVGLLQAYIFTLLSALFIGIAVHDEEH